MAKTKLNGTLVRADHHRPTAPLPAPAVEVLARLGLAFTDRSTADVLAHEAGSYVRVTPEIHRAVVRYGIGLETVARLTMLDARRMSPADYDLLADAQAELTALHEELEQAGQLHLVVAS